MGSVLFRLLVAIALRWGLNPNDLKLITAIFVFAALVLPDLRAAAAMRRAARAKAALSRCSQISRARRRRSIRAPSNEVRALHGVSLTLEEGSVRHHHRDERLGQVDAAQRGRRHRSSSTAGRSRSRASTITRWPEHRRAKFIGRVFQNPFSGTAPTMSIAENLALAARRGSRRGIGWARQPARSRTSCATAIRALNMGLEDRLDNAIGSLSGGQRQALTLLMASWLKPELLLLDEHTAALDPKSADQVIRLTRRHHRARQADDADGDALDAAGREPRRPDRDDAQGTDPARPPGKRARARARPEDLLGRFEEVRRREQLDASLAEILMRNYV